MRRATKWIHCHEKMRSDESDNNGNAALLDQLMNNPRKQVEMKLSVYTLAVLGDEVNTKNKYIQPEEETILNYSTTLIIQIT